MTSAPLFPGRLAELPHSAFAKLADLLDPVPPGAPPVSLAVGDPRGAVPDFITEAIARSAHRFGEYPPIQGTEDWRAAAGGWVKRRFGLPDAAIDPDKHVLPLNGTREGLFLAPFIVTPEQKNGARPAILLPNPFYQCYAAAILAAGAEPVYVAAAAETGFLPAFERLPTSVLARTVAAYICSPSNPEGAVADADYWRTLFGLADAHDFTVFADECYADIYRDHAPLGALTARYAETGGFRRLLCFHSLSKRSGLPGLRSGMVAGDAALMARFRALRNYAGPQVPIPLQAASAAAWNDETHVEANRAAYTEKFAVAQRILGNRAGFRLPDAGFFLWLDVGDGEDAARTLWREGGIRTLPGAYMGRESEPGKIQSNPGFSYLRVALVSDLSTIRATLERMGEILSPSGA